jgi:hypothetical protein
MDEDAPSEIEQLYLHCEQALHTPGLIVGGLSHFRLHLCVVHDSCQGASASCFEGADSRCPRLTILDLSHTSLDVVEREIGHFVLETGEIHCGGGMVVVVAAAAAVLGGGVEG